MKRYALTFVPIAEPRNLMSRIRPPQRKSGSGNVMCIARLSLAHGPSHQDRDLDYINSSMSVDAGSTSRIPKNQRPEESLWPTDPNVTQSTPARARKSENSEHDKWHGIEEYSQPGHCCGRLSQSETLMLALQ